MTRSLRQFAFADMIPFVAFYPERERPVEAWPRGSVIDALGFRLNPMKQGSQGYSESALSAQKFT
jgi:hypothetical protein